jgi:sec-independent protein translocase protein TatA
MPTLTILPLFLGSIGLPELGIILVILLFLFGGKKIPEFAKGMADSIWSFKRAMKEGKTAAKELTDEINEITTEVNEGLE